jgi:lysophospholipase L1-like esterase
MQDKPLTFAVIGDSAASGVGDSNSAGQYFGWGYHLAQAFDEPLGYINVARPGAQSREVLHEQLPKILIHEPELVAVIVGGNDLLRNNFSPKVFRNNLDATVQQIIMTGATVMLLELHDPTQIVPMPRLIARICRRRVDAVNQVTREMAFKYGAVLLNTRSLPNIYDRNKWHVDRMHPSRIGHQFIADNFGHLLRQRGFNVGQMRYALHNNRSRKDSIVWMLKNGTPWFLKRSFDLLPALLLLSITELVYMMSQCFQQTREPLAPLSLRADATSLSGLKQQPQSNSVSSMKSMAS